MTIEHFKKQADRLIKFLGDSHRFRLKRASALEAVAYIQGAADWNTLCARAAEETTKSEASTRVLTWQNGEAALRQTKPAWQKHTLAVGAPGILDEWFSMQLFESQVQNEQALFFMPDHSNLSHVFARVDTSDNLYILHDYTDPVKSSRCIRQALTAGMSVLVFTPDNRNPHKQRAYCTHLLETLFEILRTGSSGRSEQHLVVGIMDLPPFDCECLKAICAQARSAKTTLLFGVTDAMLLKTEALDVAHANIFTKLYLGGLPQEQLVQLTKQLSESAAVSVMPKSVTYGA